MRKDLTEIVVIIDRSGSMETCRQQAENGLNKFVEEQQSQPGEANLTLVQFDTEYEFVHRGKPIKSVQKFTLVPRGGTALLDAIGRAVNETGERLAKMQEADRPGLVLVVIVTDGQENSSREFTRDQIKTMIEHQKNVYNWQFTFLGANQDAFAEASRIGIGHLNAANFAAPLASNAFVAASSYTTLCRGMSSAGKESELKIVGYSEKDRKSMEGDKPEVDKLVVTWKKGS